MLFQTNELESLLVQTEVKPLLITAAVLRLNRLSQRNPDGVCDSPFNKKFMEKWFDPSSVRRKDERIFTLTSQRDYLSSISKEETTIR